MPTGDALTVLLFLAGVTLSAVFAALTAPSGWRAKTLWGFAALLGVAMGVVALGPTRIDVARLASDAPRWSLVMVVLITAIWDVWVRLKRIFGELRVALAPTAPEPPWDGSPRNIHFENLTITTSDQAVGSSTAVKAGGKSEVTIEKLATTAHTGIDASDGAQVGVGDMSHQPATKPKD